MRCEKCTRKPQDSGAFHGHMPIIFGDLLASHGPRSFVEFIKGFRRFCPSDLRCGIELDEIDPAKWALLEAATDEYVIREDATFDACAQLLVHRMVEARPAPSDVNSLALGNSDSKNESFTACHESWLSELLITCFEQEA